VELPRSSTNLRAFRRTVSMINSSKGVISEIESGNLPLTTPHSIHYVLSKAYPLDDPFEGRLGSLTSRI
jgi:hypothetical protein